MSTPDVPDEALIEQFEAAWSEGVPKIEDYAARIKDHRDIGTLRELVIIDLEFHWKNATSGERKSGMAADLESYLARFPELNSRDSVELLVAEEFTIRQRYGDRATLDSFLLRFPDHEGSLRAAHASLESRDSEKEAPKKRPTINNFQLLKEIGEGGMGSVYMAQQTEPVRRLVAVKVIRKGLDSAEVIRRFEAERQALALMDHPNISRVLDAGTTEDGLPFFAMELVDGLPITDYCEKEKIGVAERLRIFRDVCSAVHHAHQKGVLHRDLKPSNILVADQDGQPVVKVIDFGLAKAIDNTALLSDQSIRTHAGQIIGTLKYMSPEQALTSNTDVDTRADVYALGAVLYELLTGATPLDDRSFKEKGILAILELIQEHEPVRPSVRFQDDDSVDAVSARLSTSVSALRQQLQGDLDWVVMRALEKDRSRRYDSASSLAEDLKRFLNHEPVDARPPSASYRIQKFVRKNRMLVFSAAGFALLLILGIFATTWQAIRASAAEKEARRQETLAIANAKTADEQRKAAERLRDSESTAKRKAQAAAIQAKQVLDFVTNSFRSADPLRGARKDMKARDVLLHALRNVDDVSEDVEARAELCLSLGHSFRGLGDETNAIKAALAAGPLFEQATNDEKAIEANNLVAASLLSRGDGYRAWELYSRSFVKLNSLSPGQSQSREAFFSSSAIMVDTLIGLAEATVSPSADMIESADDSARTAVRAAEKYYGEIHPQTIRAHSVLAAAAEANHQPDEAIRRYESLLGKLDGESKGRADLEADVRLKFARVLLTSGDHDRSTAQTRLAIERLTERFGEMHSATMRAQCQMAECLAANSRWDDGLELITRIHSQFHPQDPSYRRAARVFVRRFLMNGQTGDSLKLVEGSYADEAWVYMSANDPKSAGDVLAEQFEMETDPGQKLHLLKRLISIRNWEGQASETASLLDDYKALLKLQEMPRMRSFFALSKLWLAEEGGDFQVLSAEAAELADTSSDPVVKVIASFLAARLKLESAPEQSDRRDAAAEAFERLAGNRSQLPDYLRWTILDAADEMARLHSGAEAKAWQERREKLKVELAEVTFNERYDRTLMDSEVTSADER